MAFIKSAKSGTPQTKQASKKRYNVSTPSEYTQNGEIKTFWRNVGSAFESDKGMTVLLEALPVNGKLFISEHVEKENQI